MLIRKVTFETLIQDGRMASSSAGHVLVECVLVADPLWATGPTQARIVTAAILAAIRSRFVCLVVRTMFILPLDSHQ